MTAATWITALFGLLGTIGGAAATVIGQRISSAQQREQAASDRAQHLADLRHEAAVALLARADALLEDIRLLHAARTSDMSPPGLPASLPTRLDELHPRYLERWRAFTTSRAAVRLAGPDSLSASGAGLRDALLAVSDVVDTWHSTSHGSGDDPGYEDAYARAQAARERFADDARVACGL